jgi:hypothetical protein
MDSVEWGLEISGLEQSIISDLGCYQPNECEDGALRPLILVMRSQSCDDICFQNFNGIDEAEKYKSRLLLGVDSHTSTPSSDVRNARSYRRQCVVLLI